MRHNVISMTKVEEVEIHGSIVAVCKKHPEFSYSYIKGLKFPFTYKGWKFTKQKINK